MAKTRAEVLAMLDVKRYDEIDGVRVKGITSGERMQWIRAAADPKSEIDTVALAVVFGAVDDNGDRLFPQVQDVDAIAAGDAKLVGDIASKVLELSGMTDEAAKSAEKNSATTPSGSSSSDSPETSEPPPAS